jgi:hypothetical protein
MVRISRPPYIDCVQRGDLESVRFPQPRGRAVFKSVEEKAPSFFLGCAVGAVVLALGGFVWPGAWVTGRTAQQMLDNAKDQATVAALEPACVAAFRAEPNAKTELAALQKVEDWKRGDAVIKEVKIPGVKSLSNEVADACATDLLKPKKT